MPQDARFAVRQVEHRRRSPDERRFLAEIDRDRVAEDQAQPFARRGRGLARPIGARDRERPGRREHRAGERMRRHTDADRRPVPTQVPAAAVGSPREHECERAWPASFGETFGHVVEPGHVASEGHRRDEHWQLQVARAALGLEDPLGRRRLVWPSAHPVHGVGGQDHELPSERRGRGNGEGVPGHGHLAITTRSRPARSGHTSTEVAPAARAASETAAAFVSWISTTTAPPESKRGADSAKSRS